MNVRRSEQQVLLYTLVCVLAGMYGYFVPAGAAGAFGVWGLGFVGGLLLRSWWSVAIIPLAVGVGVALWRIHQWGAIICYGCPTEVTPLIVVVALVVFYGGAAAWATAGMWVGMLIERKLAH